MYQIERLGGAFVLAALAVPEERCEEVTAAVNALPEVAHNYRREHALNMWFVLATETPAGIAAAVDRIEAATGLKVRLPRRRNFRGNEAGGKGMNDDSTAASSSPPRPACPSCHGPTTPGGGPGVSAEEVAARLGPCSTGIIRRIGAVPNHYAIGWTANGMTVWDVADDCVDELAPGSATLACVTHCYRRPRAFAAMALQPVRHGSRRFPRRGAGTGREQIRRLPRCRLPGRAASLLDRILKRPGASAAEGGLRRREQPVAPSAERGRRNVVPRRVVRPRRCASIWAKASSTWSMRIRQRSPKPRARGRSMAVNSPSMASTNLVRWHLPGLGAAKR